MSERAVDMNLTDLTDEEILDKAKKIRADKKARMVSVLERGLVADRSTVELPDNLYGEWVPNDKIEILRMQSFGFQIDKEYARQRALHEDSSLAGDGASIIADTIFMTCDRENKEIIDEVRAEQYAATHRPRGGKQKEERDLEEEVRSQGLPSKIRSSQEEAGLDHIKAALTATT